MFLKCDCPFDFVFLISFDLFFLFLIVTADIGERRNLSATHLDMVAKLKGE